VKLVLLIIAVVLWTIAAILVIASTHLGSLTASEFAILGLPFFGASFLPIP
jgi:hypothetical protein